MSSRISAGVNDYPGFFTLYYYKYKEKFVILQAIGII